MRNWAIIGLGFISQKHLDAIQDIGDRLHIACDIDESKKQKIPGIPFFTDWREMMAHQLFEDVEWVAICAPNHLHKELIRGATERGKKVLCEKPVVIDPKDLHDMGKNVYTVLQLRFSPELERIREDVLQLMPDVIEGIMHIEVHRDEFYQDGWKGKEEESGGLIYNIGIHYLDILVNIFGAHIRKIEVYQRSPKRILGLIAFGISGGDIANIRFTFAIDAPKDNQIRMLKIGENHYSLDRNFENLHHIVYMETVNGNGILAQSSAPAILLADEIKNSSLCEAQ